eukprot:gene8765-713_t
MVKQNDTDKLIKKCLEKKQLNMKEFAILPNVIKRQQRKMEKRHLQKVPVEVIEAELSALKKALQEKNVHYVPVPPKYRPKKTIVKAKKRRLQCKP